VAAYSVPGNASELFAFPSHKVAVNGHYVIWKQLSINPSAVVVSSRCGNLTGDGKGDGVVGCVPPVVLVNGLLSYANLMTPGLDVSAGVYNLLNQHYLYLQGYNSSHAPIPAGTLEAVLRLSYRFGF
jgi:outer membrane receptor protein involved in Fe transport